MEREQRHTADGNPRVSLVIPTFDRAEFLDDSIGSLLDQDYRNLEILVLDDGSSDGTPEILERYAQDHPGRFRWDRHENMGQALTLNRGFEMAEGDVLGYLSSDDLLLPGAVTRLVGPLVEEPEVVATYGGWDYVDDDGEKLVSVMPLEFTRQHAISKSDPGIGPGALFRRSALERVGGWSAGIQYSPDFDFWLRVASAGPIRLVPERLALYRWHEGMTGRSSAGAQIAKERLEILDGVFADPEPPRRAAGGQGRGLQDRPDRRCRPDRGQRALGSLLRRRPPDRPDVRRL